MYSNDSADFANGFIAGQNGSRNDCGNGMWGGDGSWWIVIILFALIFGWNGNNGWGNGNNAGAGFIPYAIGANGAVTRADICSEFNFNGLENAVRGIQNGLCDGFYATQTSILNGFHGVDNAICNLGYQSAQLANQTQMAIMQGNNALSSQLADCCCKTQTAIAGVNNAITGLGCSLGREIERGFADTNYNMATNTCALQTSIANSTRDIIDSQREGTRAVIDWLCAKETADLRAENQNLKLAASQERQNQYLVNTLRPCPSPAYITCNPFTGTYGGYAGYGNAYNNCGCGCNSGCGC